MITQNLLSREMTSELRAFNIEVRRAGNIEQFEWQELKNRFPSFFFLSIDSF